MHRVPVSFIIAVGYAVPAVAAETSESDILQLVAPSVDYEDPIQLEENRAKLVALGDVVIPVLCRRLLSTDNVFEASKLIDTLATLPGEKNQYLEAVPRLMHIWGDHDNRSQAIRSDVAR